jgi:hypothetical protein
LVRWTREDRNPPRKSKIDQHHRLCRPANHTSNSATTPSPPPPPNKQTNKQRYTQHTRAHRYAFPYQPYAGAPSLRTGLLLADHFAHQTALRDFNEVMPVLVLPTSFTPGLARSVDRGRAPPAPLLDLEGGGVGGSGSGVGAAGRKFGTRQGVEAVGGGGGGGGGGAAAQQGGNGAAAAASAAAVGEGGNENSSFSEGVGMAPLLGKGEALTLEKLPWRL